jgi:hypothetical protein
MRTAIICGALMAAAAISGCTTENATVAPVVAAAPPPSAPPLTWSKPAATKSSADEGGLHAAVNGRPQQPLGQPRCLLPVHACERLGVRT